MDPGHLEALTEYFRGYVSEHKQALFEKILDSRTRHLTVVLENIYQAQNASAVIRTCECFGIQDIHIIENAYKYEINKNVVLGAAKWVDIFRYNEQDNNTATALEQIKSSGYSVFAAHPDDSGISIYDLDIRNPFTILFGTEKTGLSNKALELADQKFFIPMYGFTESLNISVSAAIAINILRSRLVAEEVEFSLPESAKAALRLKWYKNMVHRADLLEKEFIKKNS